VADIVDLNRLAALLGWDQQAYMPPEGAEARGYQRALLGCLAHERQTSPVLGQLLEDLRPCAAMLDPDSDETRLVKVTGKAYDETLRLPLAFVEEFARVITLAHAAWVAAGRQADFVVSTPHLEKGCGVMLPMRRLFP
jgi:carboxypeptidase Taq